MGPILTVMMSLSSVALIFCGPVYCCNSTTVGVEDQCNYDDVEHDNCDEVEIMIMIILEIPMILLVLSKVTLPMIMTKLMMMIAGQ